MCSTNVKHSEVQPRPSFLLATRRLPRREHFAVSLIAFFAATGGIADWRWELHQRRNLAPSSGQAPMTDRAPSELYRYWLAGGGTFPPSERFRLRVRRRSYTIHATTSAMTPLPAKENGRLGFRKPHRAPGGGRSHGSDRVRPLSCLSVVRAASASFPRLLAGLGHEPVRNPSFHV